MTALLISFFLTLALTPVVIRLSHKFNILDYPKEKSVHTKPVPCLGGIIIYAVFFITLLIFKNGLSLRPLFLGSTIILLIGIYDDLKGLNPYAKISWQVAAVAVFSLSGISIAHLRLPFINFTELGCLSVPVNLYHWRAHSGAEVDLVIERDGILWPVEIKSKVNINSSDIRGLNAFRAAYPKQCGTGIVIASTEEPFLFSKDVIILPYSLC